MTRAASTSPLARAKEWMQRPSVRHGARLVGLALIAIGAIWSVTTLDLNWRSLSLELLLLNFLILSPLNTVFAAIAFRINARALGCDIPNRRSIYTVAAASVAELLPLPGGAIVRGAALVDAGAGLAASTRIIILTSLLTLFMTLALSLGALALLANPGWIWMALGGVAGSLAIAVLLLRQIAVRHLAAMIAIRFAILFLTAWRLVVAFATLGMPIGWSEAAVYVVAPTLGATIAIIPAGLGINEAIAAGLAALVAGSSAAALLAVALNRVLGICAGAVIAFALPPKRGSDRPPQPD